ARAGARAAEAKALVAARLKDRSDPWSDDDIAQHLERGNAAYWLAFSPDDAAYHAELIRAAERAAQPLVVDARPAAEGAVTEVTVYTADHPGLFAALAGAFALGGAGVVNARIVTLANGMALDVFAIQDAAGGPFDDADRLARLKRRIEDTLSGKTSSKRELETARGRVQTARLKAFTVPPRVLIENKASAANTVIEINGRDRPGFLRDITRALTALGLQISSAHISTYGERAVDVFYVRDIFGLKIESEAKIKMIREKLLEAIAPPEQAAPARAGAA
ncbi:MAG: ACT domain-containing protein, partial [Alphaproteobacteria bacterium]|nr:ACT domain-containing protein [Alphaproteobacteria bacterium]